MTLIKGSIIRINAWTTDEDIQDAVELANGPERLAAYNNSTGKSVKKFSTKAAGIKQTVKALMVLRDELAAGKFEEQPEEQPEEKPVEQPERVNGVTKEKAEADALMEKLTTVAKRKHKGGAAHDPGRYRSAYVIDQLTAGRTDLDNIAAECQERFPEVKTERKHVTWYRWKLRKSGHEI